ncbi:hypothetical protein WJX81_004075 [Elliptochloris bilobata]|uniref:Mitochondrial uncoupling protein n=1 Tax=Elliptochloris bilobata TaxID=381761 RepID=A0AAW1RAY9_9CHLO
MSPLADSAAPLSIWKSFAASAFATCTAEVATLPLDTAKVRLQLQAKSDGVPKYKGLLGTVRTVAQEEGPRALWNGLEAGLHRQFLFGGIRIGLYEPVKRLFMGEKATGEAPLYLKIAAGLTTGALAIMIANPTDLVKVRMQAASTAAQAQTVAATTGASVGGAEKAAAEARRYPNARAAYGIIAREEGVAGLWTGVGPNIARNAIINAVELASYDTIKSSLISTGFFTDSLPTHVVAGLGAGFLAVCVGSPVDVVKSRMMGDRQGQYSGMLDCFVKSFRSGGLGTFYQGFLPNFARLGSWNVVMFLTMEQAKRFLREWS